MLLLSKSDIVKSRTRPLAAGVFTMPEGAGLISVREGGLLKVKVAAGAADSEVFAGFALNERAAPSLFPAVIENATVVLVAAGKWGVVINRPVVGTARVSYASSGTALTLDAGSTFDGGEYKVSTLPDGRTFIEVVEADLGKKLNIVYTYTPTIDDLMFIGGDNSPVTFSNITSIIQETGVIEGGTVYTSDFDPTVDWAGLAASTAIKLGANGIVKTAGNGATIPNARIIEAPSADQPFLGIEFSL